MKVTKGQVMAAASGGQIQVRRKGKATNDYATVDRQIGSAAGVGDWLSLLEADGQLFAFMLLGTSAGGVVVPPTPGEDAPETAQTVTGSDTVPPTYSGTYRDGKWRTDTSHAIQGPSSWGMSRGAAFYGRKLAALPGVITSMQVRVERESYGVYAAQTPTMALLSGQSKPSGFPTVRDTTAGPSVRVGETKWWSVPSGWLADINSGAAGGIGVVGTGNYMRINGPGMRVTAKWRDER